MTDEYMSEVDLDRVIRKAVFDAARGDLADNVDPSAETLVLAGPTVSVAVRRAVMKSVERLRVMEKIGSGGPLVAGQLAIAGAKFEAAASEAESLWKVLKELNESLPVEAEDEADLPAAPVTPAVPEAQPGVREDRRSDRETKDEEPAIPGHEAGEPARKIEEPVRAAVSESPTQEAASPPAGPPVSPAEVLAKLRSTVEFGDKTPPAFKSFFWEFAERLSKEPVRPRDALDMARQHGYGASMNTLRFQLDNYLGILSKWKDEEGEAWWSMPGTGGRPTGRRRK